MKTIEELWNEAAGRSDAALFAECNNIWKHAITRFAELVRADCQAVTTETAETTRDVYEACRCATTPYFHHLPAEEQARYERIVDRARTGPPKKKTPGERLKEWAIAYLTDERSTAEYDYEAEAAKLIGGNDD